VGTIAHAEGDVYVTAVNGKDLIMTLMASERLPGWVDLHAMLTEDEMAELAGALAELEGLAEPVRRACIRAYRALTTLERAASGVEDDEAVEALYRLSPAGAILEHACELAGHLVEISGGPPVDNPDWVAYERAQAG
jgi:hypothetical protein